MLPFHILVRMVVSYSFPTKIVGVLLESIGGYLVWFLLPKNNKSNNFNNRFENMVHYLAFLFDDYLNSLLKDFALVTIYRKKHV